MRENILKKNIAGRSGIGAVFCALVLIASVATAINVSQDIKTTSEIDKIGYKIDRGELRKSFSNEGLQDFTF